MAKALPVERAYESVVIFPSDVSQKTIDGFIEKIKTTISATKGVLKNVQFWGRRKLTHTIKHNRDGVYIYLDITGNPQTPEALKNLYRVNDFVLRYATVDKVVLLTPSPRRIPSGEGVSPASAAPAVAETQHKETPSA